MSWRLGNYQIKISNRFAALETLSDSKDTKENIKISAKQGPGLFNLKQHKPWFDEECLYFSDQRKHAKMQWVQDPNQNNVDNLNNVRRDPSRYFWNKNKEYLKAKFNELETNRRSKISEMSTGASMILRQVTSLELQ
jgi:hypothetical protein